MFQLLVGVEISMTTWEKHLSPKLKTRLKLCPVGFFSFFEFSAEPEASLLTKLESADLITAIVNPNSDLRGVSDLAMDRRTRGEPRRVGPADLSIRPGRLRRPTSLMVGVNHHVDADGLIRDKNGVMDESYPGQRRYSYQHEPFDSRQP